MSWKELSPEEEDALIEKVAQKVVDMGIEFPATFLMGTVRPVAYMAGQFGRVYLEPIGFFLQGFPTEYLALLEKSENLKKIMKRVEELTEERDEIKRKEKRERQLKEVESGEKKTLRARLRRILIGS